MIFATASWSWRSHRWSLMRVSAHILRTRKLDPKAGRSIMAWSGRMTAAE